MAGATDVDELNVREPCSECVGSLRGDEIAHLAAHKKHGHAIPQNRFNRRVHPIDFGHFDGRKRRSPVDEFRIPMPVPAAIAVAQVGPESVQIRWPGAVRVVLLDRVSDLVQ
jgi:hypothetical protein